MATFRPPIPVLKHWTPKPQQSVEEKRRTAKVDFMALNTLRENRPLSLIFSPSPGEIRVREQAVKIPFSTACHVDSRASDYWTRKHGVDARAHLPRIPEECQRFKQKECSDAPFGRGRRPARGASRLSPCHHEIARPRPRIAGTCRHVRPVLPRSGPRWMLRPSR
jgi:hypothetical protein